MTAVPRECIYTQNEISYLKAWTALITDNITVRQTKFIGRP